ncbi:pyrroloquinoline quinone biosynthesis protein PqqE [Gluconacetobacter sp. 1b LMG 1731]|uniref:PqqA peptide cyclase n=1 Tax=Gluconacetobacter dulcium TaxID=2729096 RepID=A0A7W4NU35_9PROT|nr:pyrroloquinoline quinone biosynthesis protein PqqE [Gluconacetobacter dulcium]MBB2195488.1 pyrroloquinoline quinone biosynthesis protein PqqE [Gluconacetobacter dulcium]
MTIAPAPPAPVQPPMSLLAELTHRCPLQCPYCSNPLALDGREGELGTDDWRRVLEQAAELGVLQVHFSGGEPMARRDLPELVRHAASLGLYSNLITSGVLLTEATLAQLAEAGLDHVQLSFQDVDTAPAETMGGMPGAQAKKLAAARLIVAEGMPLTTNFVIHRGNVGRIGRMLDLAVELGARRAEIAHTQYYGWGLVNRAALMPSRAQLEDATRAVEDARTRLAGTLAIDYVTPDYYADQPKPCMGGWGRRFVNISPTGHVLPCHAAETITGVPIPDIRTDSLAAIWADAPLFRLFRGTDWMPEPCRGCDLREQDWGGCRCQALALLGDAAATDPVCTRSPDHARISKILADLPETPPPLVYRRYGNAPG